ncbi:8777_t:CDS:2, partial [Funneliformis geosporum]
PVVELFEEALSIILQNIPVEIETSSKRTEIPYEMPLKERDTNKALMVFNNNVTKSFNRFASKSSFNFLVCSGAAGIGKTRWGNEFFNSVKKDWSSPPSWEKPGYLYLFLDFINGVRLSSFDKNLEASTILGLRVAFDYFVCRKRKISFQEFKILVEPYIKFFGIELVLSHIKSKEFQHNQQLIIVLHID